MTEITFPALLAVFSGIWLVVRIFFWCRQGRIDWKRELQLLWVYLCTVVVLRLTFFPFSRVDGQIQPLLFDPGRMVPPRINVLPFVYLFDYPTVREILLNVIGNSVLFLPYGIVFPSYSADWIRRAKSSPQESVHRWGLNYYSFRFLTGCPI